MTHDEMIAVIQAAKERKAIQWIKRDSIAQWADVELGDGTFRFDFDTYIFRIKPEPFECWVNEYAGASMDNAYLWPTLEAATQSAKGIPNFIRTIHLREVPKP